MSFNTIVKFGVGTLFLLNLVGYLRHLTFDYWNKPTSDKEIIVENCENIFTLINDIHHYARATKIKIHEHLSCYQKGRDFYKLFYNYLLFFNKKVFLRIFL